MNARQPITWLVLPLLAGCTIRDPKIAVSDYHLVGRNVELIVTTWVREHTEPCICSCERQSDEARYFLRYQLNADLSAPSIPSDRRLLPSSEASQVPNPLRTPITRSYPGNDAEETLLIEPIDTDVNVKLFHGDQLSRTSTIDLKRVFVVNGHRYVLRRETTENSK